MRRSCFTKKPSPFCLFSRPFKIGSHSCLRSRTREETTEKPTQLSPKQKYSKLGPGCNVSIVPPGRLAPSMNALIVRCPSFFLSSFAHSAHLAHAILLHLCTPLYLLVRHLPVPVRELYYARLGKTWTWARRRAVSGGNQYLSRALPTKEPKIYGYSRLQWAIYKGAAILTSLQLKELGRQ